MNDNSKLFSRIENLFDVGALANEKILVAGCGSGGSQVAQQLVMAGIRDFTLLDNDVLEPENLIRHACGHHYLGRPKVEALADVLKDRNPTAQIDSFQENIMECSRLSEHVQNSSVVVIATDNEPTRYLLNQICVDTKTAFVIGKVFTRGIGGEVFSYRPENGGCLACLESLLERSKFREGVREIDLVSEKEREKIYGMEISEIKDSPGLNVDIAFITCFHTRFVLDAISRKIGKVPEYSPLIEHNYIVWGNRPITPFDKHFQLQRVNLAQQERCLVCGKGATNESENT